MQILPAIDLRGGQCVRLTQGDYHRETVYSSSPAEVARQFEAAGAERLHLVDLDGAKAGKPTNLDSIRAIIQAVNIPCELGGGIRDDASVRLVLEELGIDRVIIGTQALKQPVWFRQMAERYPGRVALGLDARNSLVATAGWLEISQTSALELAKQFVDVPLAAIIYTNIANDGMLRGIDEGTIDDMISLMALGFPVIASGGVTTVADVRRLSQVRRKHNRLIGAIVGRAIYEGRMTVEDAVRTAASELSGPSHQQL